MLHSGSALVGRQGWPQTEGSSAGDVAAKTGQYQCTPGWGDRGKGTGSQPHNQAPIFSVYYTLNEHPWYHVLRLTWHSHLGEGGGQE